MSKPDVWMPLYIGEYLWNTMAFTTEQHGAYLLLLMECQRHGSLPDDDRALAELAKMTKRAWIEKASSMIRRQFDVKDGRLFSPVLEQWHEWAFARQFTKEWNALRFVIFRRDDFVCQYCGDKQGPFQCDHIIPLSRGGSNEVSNLTTACRSCNQSKGARTPEEWSAS